MSQAVLLLKTGRKIDIERIIHRDGNVMNCEISNLEIAPSSPAKLNITTRSSPGIIATVLISNTDINNVISFVRCFIDNRTTSTSPCPEYYLHLRDSEVKVRSGRVSIKRKSLANILLGGKMSSTVTLDPLDMRNEKIYVKYRCHKITIGEKTAHVNFAHEQLKKLAWIRTENGPMNNGKTMGQLVLETYVGLEVDLSEFSYLDYNPWNCVIENINPLPNPLAGRRKLRLRWLVNSTIYEFHHSFRVCADDCRNGRCMPIIGYGLLSLTEIIATIFCSGTNIKFSAKCRKACKGCQDPVGCYSTCSNYQFVKSLVMKLLDMSDMIKAITGITHSVVSIIASYACGDSVGERSATHQGWGGEDSAPIQNKRIAGIGEDGKGMRSEEITECDEMDHCTLLAVVERGYRLPRYKYTKLDLRLRQHYDLCLLAFIPPVFRWYQIRSMSRNRERNGILGKMTDRLIADVVNGTGDGIGAVDLHIIALARRIYSEHRFGGEKLLREYLAYAEDDQGQ